MSLLALSLEDQELGLSSICLRNVAEDVSATYGLEQHRALVLVVYCCTLVDIQIACAVERDGE